jgi:hypothetical protein
MTKLEALDSRARRVHTDDPGGTGQATDPNFVVTNSVSALARPCNGAIRTGARLISRSKANTRVSVCVARGTVPSAVNDGFAPLADLNLNQLLWNLRQEKK